MSKAKFEAVKTLIEEEKYAEARKILKGINNPAAQLLLKELDDLDPEPKPRSGAFALVGLFVFLALILALVVVIVSQRGQLPSLTPQDAVAIPTLFPTTTPVATRAAGVSPESTQSSQPLQAQPTAIPVTATPTPPIDRNALRLSIYTYCMRKGDDTICQDISSSTVLLNDTNVINCFQLFAGALDDFGNCIRPQYATAYNEAWKRIYPSTVVPDLCKANLGVFGVPDNGNADQVCAQHSRDIISKNPYYIVDSCYDKYLSWEKIFELTEADLNRHVVNFSLCLWQRRPLPDQ